MTGPSSSTRAATASYTLTVSEDPRLVGTVRDLTAKTAEVVGIPGPAASRLTDAVEHVVTALSQRPAPDGVPRLLEIRFHVGPDALQVELVCESGAPASTPAGAPTPGSAPGGLAATGATRPGSTRSGAPRGGSSSGGGTNEARTSEWTLERWLREHDVLDAVRALAPDAELAVAGSPCACRFTCPYSSGA